MLSKNTNYLIQLNYNHFSNEPAYIYFGLISSEKRDSEWLYINSKIHYYQVDGGKMNKMIKGKNLKSGEDIKASGMHTYKLHTNLSEKKFSVYSKDYQDG